MYVTVIVRNSFLLGSAGRIYCLLKQGQSTQDRWEVTEMALNLAIKKETSSCIWLCITFKQRENKETGYSSTKGLSNEKNLQKKKEDNSAQFWTFKGLKDWNQIELQPEHSTAVSGIVKK